MFWAAPGEQRLSRVRGLARPAEIKAGRWPCKGQTLGLTPSAVGLRRATVLVLKLRLAPRGTADCDSGVKIKGATLN